jgi:urea transport system ATP-binding protein
MKPAPDLTAASVAGSAQPAAKANDVDPSTSGSHRSILYLEGVTVAFDGIRALNNINLLIYEGELRCVIGPNGAGKTTMMDVITGKTKPDSGRVILGKDLDLLRLSEPAIASAGVGRKFQKPTVFEQHPVWENLELALNTERQWYRSLHAKLPSETRDRVEATLCLTGLMPVAFRPAGQLSHGQKQRLEIGMLLMQKPRVLLLDEPAAGMSDRETEQLAELIDSLRSTCSMVVVEHDMDFVAKLAGERGQVTVMVEGSVLVEGTLDRVKKDEGVIASYLGR